MVGEGADLASGSCVRLEDTAQIWRWSKEGVDDRCGLFLERRLAGSSDGACGPLWRGGSVTAGVALGATVPAAIASGGGWRDGTGGGLIAGLGP